MTSGPLSPAFDTLGHGHVSDRFPHLVSAMDSDCMVGVVDDVLFAGTGWAAVACAPPKADVTPDGLRLQYHLKARTPAGDISDVLVLGTTFDDVERARRYERVTLTTLAKRWRARPPCPFRPSGVAGSMAMALSVFPVVGALPSLVDATDHGRMSDVLRGVAGDTAALKEIELVSLRRTPRCVLRYHLEGSDHDVVYGKVYGKLGTTGHLDHVGPGLAVLAEALRSGRADHRPVHVPRLLGHRRALDLGLYSPVPGRRADVRDALDDIVTGAAHAAAAIHTSGVSVGARRTLPGEWGRARRSIDAIAPDAPALARALTTIVDEVAAAEARTAAGAPVCGHGDFTLSQLLLSGSEVSVLDFDGLCQAEPALDLGRFASYLRLALAKADMAGGDGAVTRLVDAYRDSGGPSVREDRVRLASLVSLVLMAVRSWQQVKPRRLELVWGVLETVSLGRGDGSA